MVAEIASRRLLHQTIPGETAFVSTLTLWLGLLRIAEKAGLVDALARFLGPLFRRLMPDVPEGHPAIGLITLNFAANALKGRGSGPFDPNHDCHVVHDQGVDRKLEKGPVRLAE